MAISGNEGEPNLGGFIKGELYEKRELLCAACGNLHTTFKIRQKEARPNGYKKMRDCLTCGKETEHMEVVQETFRVQ